ncbi:MAG: hypothetical protein R5N92_03825 [Cutibacterium granulosum]|nr:hypothetical protein [Cutibacterium granulosum]
MFVEDRHVVDDARAIGRQRQPVDLTLTTAAQGPEDLTDGGDHLVEHREISTVGEDPRASQGPEIVVTVECDGFGNVLLDQTYPQCRNVLGLEVLLHRVGRVGVTELPAQLIEVSDGLRLELEKLDTLRCVSGAG